MEHGTETVGSGSCSRDHRQHPGGSSEHAQSDPAQEPFAVHRHQRLVGNRVQPLRDLLGTEATKRSGVRHFEDATQRAGAQLSFILHRASQLSH